MNTDARASDLIIIGAGPAGLSLAASLKDSGLDITIIEKQSLADIQKPQPDGREIALTHRSKQMLEDLGAWDYLDVDQRYYLREAQVLDGASDYTLDFPSPKQALGKSTDTLGYLISNYRIRESLYAQVNDADAITIRTDTTVKQVNSDEHRARVVLDSGETLTAKLVVAADSRFSESRRQMGIGADIKDFGRTVIVCRAEHTLSNRNIATEYFDYGRTLAILPLDEHLCSIVITINSTQADEILRLSDTELAASVETQLNQKLGNMTIVTQRWSYPLVGVHADRFYARRYALIGDAAVGMHPVTAHGFNLGLESQAILSEQILAAIRKEQDIGNDSLLSAYSRRHRRHTLPLYYGTNAIVNLFTTETAPAKLARQAALRAGNWFFPIKAMITKQLTG